MLSPGCSSRKHSTRSEEHTSELQSPCNLVCRLLLEKKKQTSELQSPCNLVFRLLLEQHSSRFFYPYLVYVYDPVLQINYLALPSFFFFFFFNDTATTEIYTLSLHDALPICIGLLNETGQPLPGEALNRL